MNAAPRPVAATMTETGLPSRQEPAMDLRRPYRPCQPATARFSPDAWFLAAAAVFTVALELLLGGWLVMAFTT